LVRKKGTAISSVKSVVTEDEPEFRRKIRRAVKKKGGPYLRRGGESEGQLEHQQTAKGECGVKEKPGGSFQRGLGREVRCLTIEKGERENP